MQVAADAPKRPALRYYGGKFKLAPWIISHFPKHLNYVEPCCGACSVLLQKPRSPLETVNDLDGNVVNFFRVLRDQPDELIRKIKLTPWARAEYELSLQSCDDAVEKARRFFTQCWMGLNASTVVSAATAGFRVWRENDTREKLLFFDDIETIANRLLGVQIESRNALEIINKCANKDSLIYFDPPYVEETRTKNDWYGIDWNGDDLHTESADLLRTCAGYVVVSGYACPLYTELYEAHGWHRVDKEAQTNSGGKRVESLWLSPRTWRALQHDVSDLPMFAA